MKKNCFLLFVSLFLATYISAQPVLQMSNTAPVIGESFKYYNMDTANISSVRAIASLSGAGVTWDFSTILKKDSGVVNYTDPSLSPIGATFPSADLLEENKGAISFLDVNSDSIFVIGDSTSLSMWKVEKFSDPQLRIKFPFTNTSSFTNAYSGSWYFAAMQTMLYNEGNITAEGKGYGTIVMPFGTLYNVLKIKFVFVYQFLMNGQPIGGQTDTIYRWYLPETHYPVFTFTVSSGNNMKGQFLAASNFNNIGYSEFENVSEVNLYPNPVNSIANIEYELQNQGWVKIELFGISGNKLETVYSKLNSSGKHSQQINFDDLDNGCYSVIISTPDFRTIKRIIVAR